jgi:hypothetical protein
MTSLTDYFVKIVFDDSNSTAKVQKLSAALDTTAKAISGFTAAFAISVTAVERFVNTSVKVVSSYQKISAITGIAIQDLQKWANAAQQIDLTTTAEQVMGDIQGLQSKLDAIRMGKGDITPFAMLGINPMSGNAIQVLEQIRSVISTMDRAKASIYLQDLGLGNLQQTLMATRKEFDLLAQNRFLNKKQQNDILEGGKAIKKVKLDLIALKDQAVARIMPSITILMERFFIWLQKNGDKVIDVIEKFSRGMIVFASSIARVVTAGANFIDWLFKTRTGLTVLLSVLTVLALRLKPLHQILLLVFLAVDDILAYLDGAPSIIGKFIDSFDLEKVLKTLAKVIAGLGTLYLLWKGITRIQGDNKFTRTLDNIRDRAYYNQQKNKGSKITKGVGGILGSVLGGEMIMDSLKTEEGETKTGEWIKNIAGGATAGAAAGSFVPGVGTILGGIGGAGLAALTKLFSDAKQVTMQTQVTNNNNITQHISSNADPSEIGDYTQKAIQDILDNRATMLYNNDSID